MAVLRGRLLPSQTVAMMAADDTPRCSSGAYILDFWNQGVQTTMARRSTDRTAARGGRTAATAAR